MKLWNYPKLKKLTTLALILTLLVQTTHQTGVRRFKGITFTTLEKNSLKTYRSLETQKTTAKIINQKKYTGSYIPKYHHNKNQIELDIYYRDPIKNQIESTKILTIKFPFKLTNKFQSVDVKYSTDASGSSGQLQINKKSIIHRAVEQELYVFKGEVLDSGYLLVTILSNIEVDVKTDGEGAVFYVPLFNKFEVYFEDAQFLYHTMITGAMEVRYDLRGFFVIFPFIASMVLMFIIPMGSDIISIAFFKKSETKMTFSATKMYPLSVALSGIIMTKYASTFTDYFLLFVWIFMLTLSRILMIGINFRSIQKSLKIGKNRVYVISFSLAFLGWLALNLLNFRLVLRSVYFYSFLALIDLFFLRKTASLRILVAWKVWALVMIQTFLAQMGIYSTYLMAFWSVHTSAPPSLLSLILVDFLVLILMLVPFHLRFRLSNEYRRILPRKMAKVHYGSVYLSTWPTIFPYQKKKIDEIELDYAVDKYEIDKQKNVPVSRKGLNNVPKKPSDTFTKIFNLSGQQPLLSKDYIAVGTIDSMPGIRYVVNGRKGWDLILKNRKEPVKNSIFTEKVFINDQLRRDMMVYIHKVDKRARLVSLLSRKVLVKPKFGQCTRVKPQLSFPNPIFMFLGHKKTPVFVNLQAQNIFLETAMYNGKHYKSSLQDNSDWSGPEYEDRKALGGKEINVFENLIAIKYIWVDQDDYDRDYINEAKYQFICVYKVGEADFRIRFGQNLKRITEGMFSAYRIDSFFFLNRKTLAMIMDAKVYLIDWQNQAVKKCVQIADLYAPLLSKGVKLNKCFASYWYDRKRGIVKFCVGTISGGLSYGENDINSYITDLNLIDVKYYYSGWFTESKFYSESQRSGGGQGPLSLAKNAEPNSSKNFSKNRVDSEQFHSEDRNLKSRKNEGCGGQQSQTKRIFDCKRNAVAAEIGCREAVYLNKNQIEIF